VDWSTAVQSDTAAFYCRTDCLFVYQTGVGCRLLDDESILPAAGSTVAN